MKKRHDGMRLTYLLRKLTVYRCVAYIFGSILFLYAIRRWLAHRPPATSAVPHAVREYCEVLHFSLNGMEASISPTSGLQLASVHILTRHGSRTAIEPLDAPWALDCPHALASSMTEGDRHLMGLFKALAKGGAAKQRKNKELELFEAVVEEKDFDCQERGALWPYGQAQMIRLGKYFIERYQNGAELLARFTSGDQAGARVVVKPMTTHVERTFQSAEALLFGMLSDEDWFNANLDDSYSHFFCKDQVCARCEQEGKNMAYQAYLSLVSAFEQDSVYVGLRDLYTRMHLDKEIFKDPMRIFDTSIAYICTGQALPCDKAATSCFHARDVAALKRHMDQVVHDAHNVVGSMARKSSVLLAQPFLTRVVNSINSVIGNSSVPLSRKHAFLSSDVELPVFYYSAHDTTLMPIIAALKIGNLVGFNPPYASRLIFETYRQSATNRWLVRVLFNGVDVTPLTLQGISHVDVVGQSGHKFDMIDFEDLTLWIREGMFTDAGWESNNLNKICVPAH